MSNCTHKAIYLRMQKSLDICPHRHLHPELLYQVSGSSILTVGERQFKLQSQDILITNAFATHSISQSNGYQARFLLDFNHDAQVSDLHPIHFRSEPEPQSAVLQLLRQAIVRYILFTFQSSPTALYEAGKQLLSLVLQHFVIDQPPESLANPYIQSALRFMVRHHSDPIQIQDIADACGITHTHLTRIFQRDLGLSPSKCLQDIRIEHAQQLLEVHELRPMQIAEQVGFTSLRAFRSAFEARQGMSPQKWQSYALGFREKNLGDPEMLSTILQEALHTLIETSHPVESRNFPAVSFAKSGSTLPNTLFTLLAFQDISYLHFPIYRECIQELQNTYQFKDFLVTGLLESNSIRWKQTGSDILWDFSLLDVSITYILSWGLKPFFLLSEIFDTTIPSGTLPTGSWNRFLTALFSHLQHRYGKEELAQWHCSVHQLRTESANLTTEISVWRHHCQLIRSICPTIPLGTPLICDAAAAACFRNACSESISEYDFILCTGEWFDGDTYPVYQLYTTGKRGDYINDTITHASNLAALFCRRLGKVQAMACYPLVDDVFFSQGTTEFCGETGLISRSTFPKSSMLVFQLFHQLGPTLLFSDHNICVSQSNDGYQVLFWHNHSSRPTGQNTADPSKLELSIPLHDLTPGTYRLRTTVINATYGCTFEQWKRMGSPDLTDPFDAKHFKSACFPMQTFSTIYSDGSYVLTHTLEPDEVYLAEFTLLEPSSVSQLTTIPFAFAGKKCDLP